MCCQKWGVDFKIFNILPTTNTKNGIIYLAYSLLLKLFTKAKIGATSPNMTKYQESRLFFFNRFLVLLKIFQQPLMHVGIKTRDSSLHLIT